MSAWGQGGSAKSCNALLTRVEANDPTLEDLVILPMKTFGSADVERIAAAIATGRNTHMKSLSASGHAIPPNSLARLGSALAKNKSGLVRLAIGHRNMGDEGIIAFCQELESVNGGCIQVLDFAWKDLSRNGMAALGKTFGTSPHLQKLNLSRNERVQDEGIRALCAGGSFPSLTELDLSECAFGAVGMEALSQCLQVTADTDRRSLTLLLNSNPLGSAGCVSLSSLLCGQSMISSLSLSSCNIGNEGVVVVTRALTDNACNGLKVLDLSHNNIGMDGAKALADSLWSDSGKSWMSLEEIRLAGNNNIGEEGVQCLSKALSHLSDDGQSIVARNETLQNLDLTQTNCGTHGAMAMMRSTNLTMLRLFNNKLGSNGFHELAGLLHGGHPSLVNLDLGGNSASQESVVELLTALAIVNDDLVSKLRVLEIGGNDTGLDVEEAVEVLKNVHPELDIARDRPRQEQSSS